MADSAARFWRSDTRRKGHLGTSAIRTIDRPDIPRTVKSVAAMVAVGGVTEVEGVKIVDRTNTILMIATPAVQSRMVTGGVRDGVGASQIGEIGIGLRTVSRWRLDVAWSCNGSVSLTSILVVSMDYVHD